MDKEPIVSVSHLSKVFTSGTGRKKSSLAAVDDISLDIYRRETLGLMGESGCGKSTFGRTVLRLIEPTAGSIRFEGTDITHVNMKPYRKEMQIVFQDPMGSLDPRMKIQDVIYEGIDAAGKLPKEERKKRLLELIEKVGLSAEIAERYPGELSGGQQQRIGIARALAVRPKFLVLDEAVSALDISYQAQIINLLMDIQKEDGLTYLFISHDFSAVRSISDRICIMYLGKVMELGKTEDIVKEPFHPYTRLLMSSILYPEVSDEEEELFVEDRQEGVLVRPEKGCRFANRCPYATDICLEKEPELTEIKPSHFCACFHTGETTKKCASND